MPILPKKFVRVGKGFGIWVSNYYRPTTLGVRGQFSQTYGLAQYVECGTPGTGFYARNTSSRSYRAFLKVMGRQNAPSYWKMLTGRQFSFQHEMKKAGQALRKATDENAVRLLDSYLNVLGMAAEVEELERRLRAVKDKSHHGGVGRSFSGLLTTYKSRISRLSHDVREVQLSVKNFVSEEQFKDYVVLVDAFQKASASHRIWHMKETSYGTESHQVFFDLGIFDFILSESLTPMMRDADGTMYFLYPKHLVVARSSVDFDILPLEDISVIFREIPYDRVIETLSMSDYSYYQRRHRHKHHPAVNDPDGNLLNPTGGFAAAAAASEKVRMRVVGELYIPELKLRFASQDIASAREFAHAYMEYHSKYKQVENV